MKKYLSIDGGGTKLAAILFDENMNILSSLRTEGVRCAGKIEDGAGARVKKDFASLFDGPAEIETVFIVDGMDFTKVLPADVTVKNKVVLGEGLGGILAGGAKYEGTLTIAGTGSGALKVRADGTKIRVGGLGPVFGDEGSGVWIGREAVGAVTHYLDGWGEETLLTEKLLTHYGIEKNAWYFVGSILKSDNPYRELATLVPIVAEAAREGDRVALGIFDRAADALARQAASVLKRKPDEVPGEVVICGGVFKGYEPLASLFREKLSVLAPGVPVREPLFEHVAAGPMKVLLDRGENDPVGVLREKMPQYIWRAKR